MPSEDPLSAVVPEPVPLVDPTPVPQPIQFPSPEPDLLTGRQMRMEQSARLRYARNQEHLRQSMAYATQQDPDSYGKDVRAADKLGVRPDLVAGSAEMHAAVDRDDARTDRIGRYHPELAQWLHDPTNAALVHDSLGPMRVLDVALRSLADPTVDPSGLLPAGFQFNQTGEIIEPLPGGLSAHIGGFDDLDRVLARRGESQSIREDQLRDLYAQGGSSAFLAGMAGSLASTQQALGIQTDLTRSAAEIGEASAFVDPGFGSDLMRVAGGITADLPALLAGGGFAKIGTTAIDAWKLGGELGRIAAPIRAARRALVGADKLRTYLRGAIETAAVSSPLAVREGITTGQEHGAANGALAFAIELVIPGLFGKTGKERAILGDAGRLVGGKTAAGLAGTLGREGLSEAAEESATELAHALHESASGIDPRALQPDRLFRRLAIAAVAGGLTGAGFNLPGEVLGKLAQDGVAADEAVAFRARLGALADATASNPLSERAPERLRQMVQDRTFNQSVSFDTNDWDAYWIKAGQDPIAAADRMGLRDAYLTAKAHGGSMSVPVATLVVPPQPTTEGEKTPDVKGLLDLARQVPGAPNAAMAPEIDEQAKAQIQALVKANLPAPETEAPPDPVEIIGSQLAANLEAAGVDTNEAGAYGQLFGTVFRTMATRFGVEPEALAKRFPVTARRATAEEEEATTEPGTLAQRVPASAGIRLTNAAGLRARAEAFARGELNRRSSPDEETAIIPAVSADQAVRRFNQSAFHGSPHQFESFTTAKIGSGEGAQAYGWGLYFAGRKDVAAFYRDKLAGVTIDGKSVQPGSPRFTAAKLLVATKGDQKEAIARATASTEGGRRAEIIRELKSLKKKHVEAGGRLYQVEIPEDDQFLDWDAAFSEQPPNVQEALLQIGLRPPPYRSGQSLYYDVALHVSKFDTSSGVDGFVGMDEVASRALAAAGVIGTKFLDHGSRGIGKGSHNYVVFDESAIRIAQYEQSQQDVKRADITFGKDGTSLIRLFQQADRSSVLHEMGHLWLEVLGDLASDADAPQQIRDDYAAALTFLGVESRDQVKTDQHETFARGFEKYLATGKAPSIGMRRLFARFRAWLLDVYRNLRGLNVELSPEIVGVFDRMIATDEEITAAEQEAGVSPLFLTPEQAGKTPEQFEAYRQATEDAHNRAVSDLQSELVAQYQLEQETFYREERDKVRAEIAQEIGSALVYQAIAALQDGLPDGSAPKLSKDGVLEFVDLENLGLLPGPAKAGVDRPNRGRPVYAPEGGIHPDKAAIVFGFGSGDELVRALIQAPDLNTLVDVRTDAVMHERYPDPLTDGQLQQRAQDAVENDQRERVVQEELRALRSLERSSRKVVDQAVGEAVASERSSAKAKQQQAKASADLKTDVDQLVDALGRDLMQQAVLPLVVYHEAAREIVAKQQVLKLKPESYLTAARKNAREAARLIAKESPDAEDYANAGLAKQQELLSMALYRASRDVLKRAESSRKFLASFTTEKKRAEIGKAGGWDWVVTTPYGDPEFVGSEEEARRLATETGGEFERSSGYLEQIDALLERFDLRKSLRSARALVKRESLLNWILRIETTPEGEPTGQFANIPQRMRNEAFTKNWRLLTVGELQDLHDAVANIAHLAQTKKRLLRDQGKRDLDDLVTGAVTSIDEHSAGAKSTDVQKGGLEDVGAFVGGYLASHRKIASLARSMDGFKDGGPMWDLFIRPLNEAATAQVDMSAASTKALDALFRAWGKKDGARTAVPQLGGALLSPMGRIMVALNWGNAGNRQRLMNEGWSVEQIEAFLSTLDSKDLALVQGIWDHVGSYWSEIKAKMQRVTGLAAERVEPVPFTVQSVDGKTVHMRGGYLPIVYDQRRSPNQESLTAAGMAELAMRGAQMQATTRRGHEEQRLKAVKGKRLLFDPRVITDHLNQVIHDLTHHEVLLDSSRLLSDKRLAKAMHDHYGPTAARQFRNALQDVAIDDRGASNRTEAALQYLRSGVSIAAMGFNATSALVQLTGMSQSMVRVGPKYFGMALGRIFRDATSLESTGAFIDSKSSFMRSRSQTQLRELREAIQRSNVSVARRKFTQAAFFMMTKMQRAVDMPTWIAAYEKALATGSDDATAVALADQTVIDTQGSGFIKDLSAVQRSNALSLLSPFYHYLNVQFNLTAESVGRFSRSDKSDPMTWLRFLGDFMLLYTIPAVFGLLLRDLARGAPDDDETTFADRVAKEHLTMLLGTTLLTREVGSAFQSERDYSGPAGTRGIGALVNLIHQLQQGEIDHGLERATAEALGIALRLPSVEAQRIVDAFVSDSEDSQVRAAVFGKRPSH